MNTVEQNRKRDFTSIEPDAISIVGAESIGRVVHFDSRGFLCETLRNDDPNGAGQRFAMSYTSVTLPGKFRDVDRWHVHQAQTDRFIVTIGEMMLALYDARVESESFGTIEIVRMTGAPFNHLSSEPSADKETALVPIPPGVYHCIGNLSSQPFVLTNFPTELYDPRDEGRVPFSSALLGTSKDVFSWERVKVVRE